MSKKYTKKLKSQSRHRNKKSVKQSIFGGVKVLFFAGMMLLGAALGGLQAYQVKPAVLAYATNVSHAGLLASTNQHRASNGQGALVLNTKLNNAAQVKANDMVTHDYWSHTSPSGVEPWTLITNAGYVYSTAGENLAYGALTSEETVQAWMNSPGHKANILNTQFTEVGFGFANSANYQSNGPQTVVVAMYAKPYGATPSPAPSQPKSKPKSKPAQSPAPASNVAKPSTPAPAQKPASNKKSQDEKEAEKASKEEPKEEKTEAVPTQIEQGIGQTINPVEQTVDIRRIEILTGNYTGWAVAGVLLVGMLAVGTFLYRHSKAWHRRIIKGEEFIIHHPLIDVLVVICIILVVVLLQTVGRVL